MVLVGDAIVGGGARYWVLDGNAVSWLPIGKLRANIYSTLV